jgi:hypothetical protein
VLWVVPNWAAFLDVGASGFDRPPKSVDDLAGGKFDLVITICDQAQGWPRDIFAVPFGDMTFTGCFGLIKTFFESRSNEMMPKL